MRLIGLLMRRSYSQLKLGSTNDVITFMVIKFEIFTDNSACSWLLRHPKVSAKLARYLTTFAQYTLIIVHIYDALNVVADALYRRPDATVVENFHYHKCILVATNEMLVYFVHHRCQLCLGRKLRLCKSPP